MPGNIQYRLAKMLMYYKIDILGDKINKIINTKYNKKGLNIVKINRLKYF